MRGPVAAALAVAVFATTVAAEETPAQVTAALERIKDESTVELVTTGRKTGKQHVRPIWFVVDHGEILVQAGKDGKTDWYLNLLKDPDAVVHVGEVRLRVRAVPVLDAKRLEDVHQLFLRKYMTARLLSWFGSSIGRGKPVELQPLGLVER
jgi:deazaflavin-dependent oxidoreductase (nitroreductase family)